MAQDDRAYGISSDDGIWYEFSGGIVDGVADEKVLLLRSQYTNGWSHTRQLDQKHASPTTLSVRVNIQYLIQDAERQRAYPRLRRRARWRSPTPSMRITTSFTLRMLMHMPIRARSGVAKRWRNRLDVLPGLLAVGTSRYGGPIPVEVEVCTQRPPDTALGDWDHVVECSLTVASGRILLTSPFVRILRNQQSSSRRAHIGHWCTLALWIVCQRRTILVGDDHYRAVAAIQPSTATGSEREPLP